MYRRYEARIKGWQYKVFVNTLGNKQGLKAPLQSFIDYINTGEPSDRFTEKLNAAVALQRADDRKAAYYMTWEQEQMEAEARGRKEGKHEALLATARQMKADGVAVDKIMQYTGLSKEEVEEA